MKLLRIFGIASDSILTRGYRTEGIVIQVNASLLHVVKKPVRLYPNETNTLFSHYIRFRYTVDAVEYTGILFVDLRYHCPQKGETIEVFYDPDKPENYACYPFGPTGRQIGW